MARILEIREICERALRRIGTYSIRDSGADAAELEEARLWLDMVMGHLAARQRTWWLTPETAQVPMTVGVADYPLASALPAGDPLSATIMVKAVDLASAQRDDVHLARRWEWEARTEVQPDSGRQWMVYVDRTPSPVLRIYPTPVDPLTHRLEVVFQRVSPDLTTGPVTEKVLKFRQAWNLYIVTALAAQIGNGPVRKMPADEVREMQSQAKDLLFDLECFDSHEQAGEPRLITYNEF
jgi:hypothetical protein